MTQYIADEAHFKEVIERAAKVKSSLWIGTADIKDLYVEERPFLGILADLIKKGKEVRLIHAKDTGYFKKAESLYEEEDSQGSETPMYEWYKDSKVNDWVL